MYDCYYLGNLFGTVGVEISVLSLKDL